MTTISIIGLGYVGLPLAVAFSKKYKVIGFDINHQRIEELKRGYDRTLEVGEDQLKEALEQGIEFTSNLEDIKRASIHVVTVPTPIDKHKNPDLTPLIMASRSLGRVLKKGDIVIYESTVYPGCTEEVCVPELERESGLKYNEDFYCGYSPERINPGDKEHTVTKIKKVTSGSTPEIAKRVDELYKSIIEAGTHLAPSIKVAEAAKVIENAQRDINIAFVNELALIFDKLNIDTLDVLEAAGTKWNFLKFKPGLVGGHCQVGSEFITIKEDKKIKTLTFEEFFNSLDARILKIGPTTFKIPKKEIEVLSFNPKKGFNFEKAKVFTNRVYDRFIKIKTSLGDTLTFSNKHPFIVKNDENYDVKFADELKVGDEIPLISKLPTLFKNIKFNLIDLFKNSNIKIRVKLKVGSWKDYKEFISKKYLNCKVSNFLYLDYLPIEKYLLIRDKLNLDESNLLLITGRGPSTSKIDAVINLDKDFARLIGYYLSEGCITKDKSIRIRFTINKQEKELKEDILSILSKLNLSFSIYEDKKFNALTIKVSNQLLGKLFEYLEVGKDSCNAKILDKILFNEDKIKLEVLKGLFRGDGGFSYPRKISYYTSSDILFQQIVLLLRHFDINPFIQKRKNMLEIYALEDLKKMKEFFLDEKKEKLLQAIKNTKQINYKRKSYKSDGLFIVNIKEIETFKKEKAIYSLEVANTHNYVTTNGVITHNCIGVDPYYLAFKAKEIGYHPEIILAGRRTNDNMGVFVANKVVKLMIKKGHTIKGSRVLVLGITFKENCPDIRNSRVIDIIEELKEFGVNVDVYDPWADSAEVKREYDINLLQITNNQLPITNYDSIVLAVAHKEFRELEDKLKEVRSKKSDLVIYDIKGFFDKSLVDRRL